MRAARMTVLLLVPGRSTVSFEFDASWRGALFACLCVPLLMGAGARRCLDGWHGDSAGRVVAADMAGRLDLPSLSAQLVEDPLANVRLDDIDVRMFAAISGFGAHRARPLRAPSAKAIAPLPPLPALSGSSWLRVQSTHLGEALRVRPFDDAGQPDANVFDAVRHLMRCRTTGDEVAIDPRLVRVLVQIGAAFDRPIQLVSGHRAPTALGTHSTSQHVLGKAADIRIPGVSIEQLRSVALKVGARGIGMYPEKGFVHVDVRDKAKYYWTWTQERGEEADMR
jgi:uncharacterized protein YcbK (DUF882 family)